MRLTSFVRYLLHPFLELVSVSKIHDRGHKRDVHFYIGVNHNHNRLEYNFDHIIGFYSYIGE